MRRVGNYQIKIAESENEFNHIHRLNYKTFVEEIPQHQGNEKGSLIDRFHSENTYIIALEGGELAGMIAVRGERPFSLDSKIPDLDQYLPTNKSICEIRLLAVEKEHRGGPVFFLLMKGLAQYCREMDYNYAVISGTTRQQKLYRHLGFAPFYSAVGKKGACYIPMQAAVEDFEKNLGELICKYENHHSL
ncbi:MAG: GNAT family N-acetyltransferase [Bacillota bacterium]